MSFKRAQLYGGAILSSIPVDFVDASDLRQVPDHQEVFVSNGQSEESLIFEIMERLDCGDEEAVTEHLKELSALNGAPIKLMKMEKGLIPSMSATPVYVCTGVQDSRKWGRTEQVSTETAKVVSLIAVIRIAKAETDFIITLNVPCKSEQQLAELEQFENNQIVHRFSEARMQLDNSLAAFQIADWGLFG